VRDRGIGFKGKDFGTPFDRFDPRSAARHPAISGEARTNRLRLEALMYKQGYENLAGEWWHFTFSALKVAPIVDVEIE